MRLVEVAIFESTLQRISRLTQVTLGRWFLSTEWPLVPPHISEASPTALPIFQASLRRMELTRPHGLAVATLSITKRAVNFCLKAAFLDIETFNNSEI